MLNRRGFLAALPALVAGLTALRTIPQPAPVPDLGDHGLLALVDDGTQVHSYAGVPRDSYETYYRVKYEFHVAQPRDSFRLSA